MKQNLDNFFFRSWLFACRRKYKTWTHVMHFKWGLECTEPNLIHFIWGWWANGHFLSFIARNKSKESILQYFSQGNYGLRLLGEWNSLFLVSNPSIESCNLQRSWNMRRLPEDTLRGAHRWCSLPGGGQWGNLGNTTLLGASCGIVSQPGSSTSSF